MSAVDVSPKPPSGPAYLGDAVYASFDGYQIWLHLNDHRSTGLIALDPDTFESLKRYAQSVWGQISLERVKNCGPDLLEALRDMVSDHAELSQATVDNARRVIAKAEGKS